jgi:hypothetical protein
MLKKRTNLLLVFDLPQSSIGFGVNLSKTWSRCMGFAMETNEIEAIDS